MANIGFSPTLGNNYPFVYVNSFNSGNAETTPLGATPVVMETALTNVNVQDPTLANPNGLTLIGRDPDYQTPYTQTFNLTTQYQFTRNDSIQVGYVGVLGRHLDSLTHINSTSQILPIGTNVQDFVPFPDFARDSPNERTNATSNYRSLPKLPTMASVQFKHNRPVGPSFDVLWE